MPAAQKLTPFVLSAVLFCAVKFPLMALEDRLGIVLWDQLSTFLATSAATCLAQIALNRRFVGKEWPWILVIFLFAHVTPQTLWATIATVWDFQNVAYNSWDSPYFNAFLFASFYIILHALLLAAAKDLGTFLSRQPKASEPPRNKSRHESAG